MQEAQKDKLQNVQVMCPNCGERPAVLHPQFGYIPCTECQEKDLVNPNKQVEFTSESIKDQRKQYFDDIHGSHRSGVASREYRDRWGRDAMKRQGFTDKEIDNAKYVWSGDDTYYSRGDK